MTTSARPSRRNSGGVRAVGKRSGFISLTCDAMNETTVEVNGVRLYTRRVGDGPPAAVLHGGPGAHHDYLLPQYDRLARGRALYYYAQRGVGRSPVPRGTPVGWREQVADLAALRAHWGIDHLTLLGYSWGGLLAVLYALEHAGAIERLALVAPAPLTAAGRDEFQRRFAARMAEPWIARARAELAASGLARTDPERYRRLAFALSVAGYFRDPRRAAELTPFRVTARTQDAVWESLGAYDLRDLRAPPSQRPRAARRDDPVGTIDRRAGQPGDPRVVREAPVGTRLRDREPGGIGAGDPQHRVLPQQDQVDHRDGAGAGGTPWRRGARHHG